MNERANAIMSVIEKFLVELAVELDTEYGQVDIKLLIDLACPIGEGLHALT